MKPQDFQIAHDIHDHLTVYYRESKVLDFAEQYHKAKLKDLKEWVERNQTHVYSDKSKSHVNTDELLTKLKEL